MITIEVNDPEVSAIFARIVASLTDLTPLMQDIGELLVFSTKDRFDQGVSPDGVGWAPKSPTTIAAYTRRGEKVDFRPLFGTSGDLHKYISFQADSNEVRVGSNLIYAAVMQFGAAQGAFGAHIGRTTPSEKQPKSQDHFHPVPWGNIPARPFLGISEGDRTNIVATVTEWLDRIVAAGD